MKLFDRHFADPRASVYVDGESIRAAALGVKVEKTAAVPASGSTDDLFSVDGGAVYLIDLIGIVETALVADTDLSLQFDPDDGGSDVDLADSSTPLVADSDPTGTIYSLNGTFGGDLVASLDAAQVGRIGTNVIVLADDGNIKLTSAGGGAGGGSIHWYLFYIPIETGAVVTAA